jgi:hypothetical protein
MIKAVVAVVSEGGSRVVIRGIRHGSGLNQEDLGAAGINSPALEVACPRRELERKFEIVLCWKLLIAAGVTYPNTLVVLLVVACPAGNWSEKMR